MNADLDIETCEQIADAVLKAAGTGLDNYTMVRTRARIIEAAGVAALDALQKVIITDDMVERAVKEIRKRTGFPFEYCRKLARAALEAALSAQIKEG